MEIAALPGFRDFYPQEFAERAHVFAAWREVARRYAFTEYDGPPLEALELYTRKSGDEIVTQLYTFKDQGGRDITLRPEMTPTLARMVGARARALRLPVRWFSIPQLFRYERPQKGRLREHYQLNVDIVGEPAPVPDAELLALGLDIMRMLGLTDRDVEARVSDRRLLTAYLLTIGVPEQALAGAYAVIDKLARQSEAVSAEKLAATGVPQSAIAAVLRVPKVTFDEIATQLADAGRSNEDTARCLAEFKAYLEHLDALGVGPFVRFDLSIVRGLAYYTGIVFELFDKQGEFRAICGGGRYDKLLASLGGPDMPALGFGMGDVVLTELLRARGLLKSATTSLDYWVAGEEGVSLDAIMRQATDLRSKGFSVEYSMRGQSLAKQMKAAKSLGAREIMVIPAQKAHG